MEYIVTSNEMKEIDCYTIDSIKIPAMVLMERAAIAVVNHILKHFQKSDRILVICGTGNNGADGIAIARLLHENGCFVNAVILGDEETSSKEMKLQLEIARNIGVCLFDNVNVKEYSIIVDAMFGIGLSRPVFGVFEEMIRQINTTCNLVFSVDVPTGVNADTGKIMNIAVKANYTITFGWNKLGMILHPGCMYAGEVIVENIGFPKIVIEKVNPQIFLYDANDLRRLPKRSDYSNKGSYGRVLIIAGSKNMSGACLLSAKAAYRSGAGLVKVLTTEENREIIQTSLPEALISPYPYQDFEKESQIVHIRKEIEWATVIVIGPGIGISHTSEQLVNLVLSHAKIPIIVDADALNILSQNIYAENNELYNLPNNVILTPHLKEMSRLLHVNVNEVVENLMETSLGFTRNNNCMLALKDARTIVTDGKRVFINTSGNNGMATGGSGDVLTGIIAAFIAQGLDPFEATSLGVYVHGLAADAYVKENNKYSLMASDIIDALSVVLA